MTFETEIKDKTMAVAKPRKWIQKAIKKPGAFTRYSKRKGYKGVTEASIQEGIKTGGKIARRARLARTLRGMK